MNALKTRWITAVAVTAATVLVATRLSAHPLPGRDLLKFAQEPMVATQIVNTTGQINTYFGHDEFSTAYGYGTPAQLGTDYQGRFMADDFADNITSPVVHLTWWGSYMNNNFAAQPQAPVKRFLIAFESDLPVGDPNNSKPFSVPGQVLQFDVVDAGALAPGSGTFTETLIPRPVGDPLNEPLYEYNAELHLNRIFPELKDTVYWVKIAALVDLPAGVPPVPAPGITQWGWHNRDYTIQNTLASPAVAPGETVLGMADSASVWHFQDDAVSGDLRFLPFNVAPNPKIFQPQGTFNDENYVNTIPGVIGQIDGPNGIQNFSKDLAFRLYTTQIPEPASCLLVVMGMAGLVAVRRSSRAV